MLLPGFERRRIATDDGIEIHALVGGRGPPLLMLHGHPQTHAMWHEVAAVLAAQFTLVLADLRGYGDSSKPRSDPDHANYGKRVMARDMLRAMQALGHPRFDVLAHDRGARVAHRLALDHDRADRAAGRRIEAPLPVLWGAQGVVHRCFRPLAEWQRVAADVRGESLACGHYIAEEAPDALLARVLPFLAQAREPV